MEGVCLQMNGKFAEGLTGAESLYHSVEIVRVRNKVCCCYVEVENNQAAQTNSKSWSKR